MNWKTTVGGVLMAIGSGLTTMGGNWTYIGSIITGIGGLLTGIMAMDATSSVKNPVSTQVSTVEVQDSPVPESLQIPEVKPFQYPAKKVDVDIKEVVKDAIIDAGTSLADAIRHNVSKKSKNKGEFDWWFYE